MNGNKIHIDCGSSAPDANNRDKTRDSLKLHKFPLVCWIFNLRRALFCYFGRNFSPLDFCEINVFTPIHANFPNFTVSTCRTFQLFKNLLSIQL